MTYRNELDQAHQRIEQLEEALRDERAKNEPAPVAPEPARDAVPRRSLEWFLWWPVPLMLATAIACFVPVHDEMVPWLIRSACAGSAIMSLEAFIRWLHDGERTAMGRLLVVLGCVVGAPAIVTAFFIGGPILGIGMAAVAAIAGLVALVKWIIRGES